jgi:ATP phosphoribosyltransferase regulatory subunit
VLEKAKSLTDEEECIQAVNRLEELYELLKNNNYDKYISFDLGDLSEHADINTSAS